MQIMVNGEIQADITPGTDGYITLNRTWNDGDKVTFSLPMKIYPEAMPDNPSRIALFYGPVILAAVLGDKEPDPVTGMPVMVTTSNDPATWVKQDAQQSLVFHTSQTGQPKDITLVPFNTVQKEYYSVYLDAFTPQAWAVQQEKYAGEKKRQQQIEARTVDMLRVGEMQPERDHQFISENAVTGDEHGRKWRMTEEGGTMAFTMKVDANSNNSLLCTYWGMDNRYRKFDILVDGEKIASEDLNRYKASKFYEIIYNIPVNLTKGKQQVTIIMKAGPQHTAGPVYGPIRVTRE
jgi:hypothetical protein